MSVAFRRDGDEEHLEPKFERPIPPGPNWVTARGAAQIEARLGEYAALIPTLSDEAEIAKARRELRYWQTRQATAQLIDAPDGITFDTGSYTLKPQFRSTLGQVAQTLTAHPDSLIDVYGHTDSTGSAQLNQQLSENRARTVADFLTTQGVSPARLRSQGFGETMPVASNATPEGRAKNRRVEIRIVPVTQEQVQAARSPHS